MFLGALVGGIIGDKPVAEMRSSSMRPFILPRWWWCFFTEYGFPYCLPFCDGRWLGALLVTLFAGFTEYMPGRNAERGPVGFLLLATGHIRSVLDCDGTHAAD